ncbi:sialidase family protein [Denitratisoma sp. agr-D3]
MIPRLLTGLMAPILALALAFPGLAHEGHGTTSDRGAMAKQGKSSLAIGVGVAPDGRLWVVGVDDAGRLFMRGSDDLGRHWQPARVLDTGSDSISADGENHPKIAFGNQGQVVISYTKPLAKPYTGEIRLLRSTDGGENFSPPVTVHSDRRMITHRFESILFDAQGTLHTVWIDKRDQVDAGAAGYRGAAIYRNESRDGGGHFGADIKVADHSCECCRIALARTADGQVAALWRHVFPPNIRDHAFALLGEGNTVVRATQDDWKIDACPHHGPGLALAQNGDYHAVWYGDRNNRPAVRYGRLLADGRPDGPVQELPDPRAEHADIATLGGQVVIVWRSYDGTATHLSAWLSDDDGAHFRLRELATTAEDNDHPRMVVTPAGIRVLWRTTSDIHVYAPIP